MVPVLKNVGDGYRAKNYCHVSLLSVVNKVFEKLVNNMIVDHLKKCDLFSDFQYGFRYSHLTAHILTFARVFNKSGTTRAVALDISKAFDRVWHAGLLQKCQLHGISSQIFGLISSFLSNRWLGVVLDGNSSQEYPVSGGVPQGSILGPTIFLLYINDLRNDVICDIAIYTDETTLYSNCDQASVCGTNLNWLLNLNLIYETPWTGVRSSLLISILGKLNCFHLTILITLVLLM